MSEYGGLDMNGYLRSYLLIDLGKIEHNIDEVKKRVPQGTKIVAVVKADAYGHGAVAVARKLHEKVDFFAVAEIDEAVELREAGVTKGILILGYTSAKEAPLLVQYDVSQAVYTFDMAKAVSDAAVSTGKTANIHIAADTGMTRIGYRYSSESIEEIVRISRLPGIRIEGLFTHFSCADMTDRAYSNMQAELFSKFVSDLKKNNVEPEYIHICNSAGIMEYSNEYYNMVRSGIVTYGLWPSDEVDKTTLDIKPALSWKTHVVNVKEVPENTAVSYGATYVTDKKTKIATVSVGYADGYPRSLSSKARVLIHGQSAKVIGRVCMDQMMVDVTDIDNVNIEDEVTLIGKDGNECITVDELAALSGRFNYEFVCDINKRVIRVYK